MKKDKKKQKKSKAQSHLTRWDKAKLYGTIGVIIWLALTANGVQLSALASTDNAIVEDIALASMLPTLPKVKVTKPGGVAIAAEPKPYVLGVVGPIRSVPDSLNNYRGRGITPAQLKTFLASSGVQKVMNLSGDIPGKITAAEAQAVCAALKVEYLTSGTLNRFAARSAGGNVLVIDRSGNRAGALIGYHLGALGFTREQIIMHNNWEQLARDPGKNLGYLETALGSLKIAGE